MKNEKELKDEKKRKAGTEKSKNKKQKVGTTELENESSKIDTIESQEMITTAWYEEVPAEIWVEIFSNLELKELVKSRSVSSFFKICIDNNKQTLIDNALRRRAKELVKIARSLGVSPEAVKYFESAIRYLEKVSNKKDQDYQDIFDFAHDKIVNYLLNNTTIMDRNNIRISFRAIPQKNWIDFLYAAANEHELGILYIEENNIPEAISCFQENLNYLFQYTFGYLIFENNFLGEDTRFLYGSDFEFFKHHPFDSMEYHIYSLMYKWVCGKNANMKNLVNALSNFKLKDIKNPTLLLHLYEFILYVFSIDEEIANDNENLDNAQIFQAFQKDENSQQTFEEILEELEPLIGEKQLQTRYSWQYNQQYLNEQETEDETISMNCN